MQMEQLLNILLHPFILWNIYLKEWASHKGHVLFTDPPIGSLTLQKELQCVNLSAGALTDATWAFPLIGCQPIQSLQMWDPILCTSVSASAADKLWRRRKADKVRSDPFGHCLSLEQWDRSGERPSLSIAIGQRWPTWYPSDVEPQFPLPWSLAMLAGVDGSKSAKHLESSKLTTPA